MYEVSTSILNIEKGRESETILNLEKAKTDYFHIDVMDGKFVEKNTYNKMQNLSSYIKRTSNIPLDVHLMVYDVKTAIQDFIVYNPNLITFHIEAFKNEEKVMETIKYLKNNNVRIGIAVKPKTNIEEIYKYLPFIHLILVMTVEPGKGGQTFLSDMINKIETLKKYIDEHKLETEIEVDGGINLATCEIVKNAGATMLVSGTAILIAKNYKDIIDELKK